MPPELSEVPFAAADLDFELTDFDFVSSVEADPPDGFAALSEVVRSPPATVFGFSSPLTGEVSLACAFSGLEVAFFAPFFDFAEGEVSPVFSEVVLAEPPAALVVDFPLAFSPERVPFRFFFSELVFDSPVFLSDVVFSDVLAILSISLILIGDGSSDSLHSSGHESIELI